MLSGNDDAGEKGTASAAGRQKHKELALLYEQYKRYWESGKSNAGADVEAALTRTWSRIGAGEKMEEIQKKQCICLPAPGGYGGRLQLQCW